MDFIIVSTADWNHPLWTNKQHVAKTLAAKGHRILYVESMGLRRPFIGKRDAYRIGRRIRSCSKGLQNVSENIWVFSPISVPLQRFSPIRRFNLRLLQWMIGIFGKRLGFKAPILWTYNPLVGGLIGNCSEKMAVYHCVDELAAQPGMPALTIREEEKELIAAVDAVFTTSRQLDEKCRKINPNTHYFPNVCDFDHFHNAYANRARIPAELEGIAHPRIGFVGAISRYKIDFDLVRFLAASRPQYQFVFIGSVGEGEENAEPDLWSEHDNVYSLGHRPYQELPDYFQAMDVCMIPSCINEYTRSMFPMKFFEYMAAGRPVVAMDTGSLTEFADSCFLCRTYEEFVNAIDRALGAEGADRKQKGMALAREYTYERRTEKMLAVLEELFVR